MTGNQRRQIDQQTFSDVVFLLADYLGERERESVVNLAFFGLPILRNIEFSGGNIQFTTQLVTKALAFGEDNSGQPSLFALMDVIHANVGRNKQAKIAQLKQQIQRQLYGEPLIPQPSLVTRITQGSASLQAEAGYFRVWLRAFYLSAAVEWFSRFYPLMYSTVSAVGAHRDPTPLLASRMMPIHAGMIGQAQAVSFPLTGIMPYHGGEVLLELNINALEDGQCSALAMSILANAQRLLDAPTNRTLLDAQMLGINTALNAQGAKPYLILRYALTDDAAQALPSGTLAILSGTVETLPQGALGFNAQGLTLDGTTITDRDYFVLEVEHIPEREGWQFGTLGDLLDLIDRAFYDDDHTLADVLIEALKYALYESPEYTLKDKTQIAERLKQSIDYLRTPPTTEDATSTPESLNTLLKRPMTFFAQTTPTTPQRSIRTAEDILTYF